MTTSPYPGLRPFKWDESDIFFGREEQCDQLIDKLAGNRFIAVVGPSGCGKSSLVRAGLIADLNSGYMGTDRDYWEIIKMRPGRWPLNRLSQAFRKALGLEKKKGDAPEIHCVLSGIIKEIEAAGGIPKDTNIFLLVDQFEEIFRLSTEGNFTEAAAFVSLLLDLANQDKFPIYVVITMRTDYIGDCTLFHGLPEAINQGLFLTPRLNQEQLHDAIVGPARVFGGDVDYLLVDQLLRSVGSDPDQLPLMQHVLMRTYDHVTNQNKNQPPASGGETNFTLTLKAYEKVGGLEHALSNHADEAYEKALKLDVENPAYITETLFRCLSIRDKGQRDIRNPAKVSHIAGVSGAQAQEVEEIVNIFLENNFIMHFSDQEEHSPGTEQATESASNESSLVNSSPILDISHESLIRQWEKMSGTKTKGEETEGWVELEAQKAETYLRLAEDAQFWDKQDPEKKDDYLAEKRALDHAMVWKRDENPNRHWAKKYDRPLANAQSKELSQMYDNVLANRQDVALFESYKKERDNWCEARFKLAMNYLDQSMKKKVKKERRSSFKKGVLVFLCLILAAIIPVGIVYYFNKLRLENKSKDSKFLETQAQDLLSHGNQNLLKAIEKYDEAIRKTPNISRLYINLAALYFQQGKENQKKNPEAATHSFELAKTKYNNALALDEKNIEAINGLGWTYLELRQTAESRAKFEKVITTDPNNTTALNGLLAVSTRELSQTDPDKKESIEKKIKTNYEKAYKGIEQHPVIQNFLSACVGLADVYTSMQEYESALEYYQKAHNLNPGETSLLNKIGYAYSKLGRDKEALAYYRRAIDIYINKNIRDDLSKASTYYGLGAVYTKLGKFDHAAIAYKRAAEINPENPIGHNGQGTVWLGRNGFNKAMKHFDLALETIPENQKDSTLTALIYVGKGYALLGLNRTQDSQKAFEQAFKIDNHARGIFDKNNQIIQSALSKHLET